MNLTFSPPVPGTPVPLVHHLFPVDRADETTLIDRWIWTGRKLHSSFKRSALRMCEARGYFPVLNMLTSNIFQWIKAIFLEKNPDFCSDFAILFVTTVLRTKNKMIQIVYHVFICGFLDWKDLYLPACTFVLTIYTTVYTVQWRCLSMNFCEISPAAGACGSLSAGRRGGEKVKGVGTAD